MGAITSKLDAAPDPKATPFDPNTSVEAEKTANKQELERKAAFVTKIVGELGAKGIQPPAKDPATMTKTELQSYLQTVIGNRIKEELTNNPLGLDYAGKSNDEIAEMLNEPFKMVGRRLAGSVVMEVIEPLDPQVITLGRGKGMAVDLRPFGANLAGKILRIDKAGRKLMAEARAEVEKELGGRKVEEVVEGRQEGVIVSNLTNKVELAEPLASPLEVGDVVTIIDTDASLLSCRIHQITLGIPFAPNVVTGSDVAAARQ